MSHPTPTKVTGSKAKVMAPCEVHIPDTHNSYSDGSPEPRNKYSEETIEEECTCLRIGLQSQHRHIEDLYAKDREKSQRLEELYKILEQLLIAHYKLRQEVDNLKEDRMKNATREQEVSKI
jgi:hypothetical protein